jgi:signal transduction histidine kinase
MIIRSVLILLLFIVKSFAYESFDISSMDNTTSSREYLYCIKETTKKLNFKDLLNSQELIKMNKSNVGYTKSTFWCRIDLHNSSNKAIEKILYNPRPGVDFVDAQVYQNDKIRTLSMGDMRPLENRDLNSIYSNFTLTLDAKETATIITKYKSIGIVQVNWKISDIKEFISLQNINFTLIFLYIGFMLAIMFSKIFTYYYIKDKIYIIYAVFVFSAIISNISNMGTLHYFFYSYIDDFTITIIGFIFSHIFLASLWVFSYYFFMIDKSSRFYYLFMFIISYNTLIVCLYTYSYIDVSVLLLTPMIILVALVESAVMLLFSFIMFMKKKAGSFLFFVAHLSYVVAVIFFILNLAGKESDPVNSMLISSLGIFLATFFMSLSLSSRFKALKDENDAIKLEIAKNKGFTLIGTTISFVAHQWRQPLTILSSQLMKIKAISDNTPDVKISKISYDLDKMDKSIVFINDTLSSIQSLFQIDTTKKANFSLNETLTIIRNSFSENSTKIKIDNKNDIQLYGNQNLFIHAINNIIQNSIDALQSINIKKGFVKIQNHSPHNLLLYIEDNAGGIDKKTLQTLFKNKNSNKNYGMGIGLSITKDILDNEFSSNITIENIQNGTRFIIKNEKN